MKHPSSLTISYEVTLTPSSRELTDLENRAPLSWRGISAFLRVVMELAYQSELLGIVFVTIPLFFQGKKAIAHILY